MTRLYLVRHGETDWNSAIRIQGHQDIPLSEQGRQQARAVSRRLAGVPVDVAYASDLRRATETAALVLDGRGIVVRRDARLREAGFGAWEGLTYAEVTRLYPTEQAARRARPAEVAPPGGELLATVLDRVKQAVDGILFDCPDQSVVVVTHGGPLRLLLGHLLGLGLESYWKVRIDNCSLSIIDTYPEGAIVSLLNDTCHLAATSGDGDVP